MISTFKPYSEFCDAVYLSQNEKYLITHGKNRFESNWSFKLWNLPILEINCPNNLKRLKCTENRIKWTCEQCKSVFIYGFDFKFYCKCGGGECNNFRFKCADINHQNEFVRFSDNQLKSLLNKFYHSKY